MRRGPTMSPQADDDGGSTVHYEGSVWLFASEREACSNWKTAGSGTQSGYQWFGQSLFRSRRASPESGFQRFIGAHFQLETASERDKERALERLEKLYDQVLSDYVEDLVASSQQVGWSEEASADSSSHDSNFSFLDEILGNSSLWPWQSWRQTLLKFKATALSWLAVFLSTLYGLSFWQAVGWCLNILED